MRKTILFLSIAALLSSCKNLVPYTDAMRQQHNWSNDDMKRIQFYVSHDIILHREFSSAKTEIAQGKIKMIKGKKVDEIIIQAGTKGVVTDIPKENKMLVSFETGDDRYLSFGVNPNASNKYVLLATDWNNEMGKVHYSGTEYYTDPDSKYASLLVDLRRIDDRQLKQHIAKGRKVK